MTVVQNMRIQGGAVIGSAVMARRPAHTGDGGVVKIQSRSLP